jgi:hypothetical protein
MAGIVMSVHPLTIATRIALCVTHCFRVTVVAAAPIWEHAYACHSMLERLVANVHQAL